MYFESDTTAQLGFSSYHRYHPSGSGSSQLRYLCSIARGPEDHLTHVDADGKASMVDISHKSLSKRVAVASGQIVLGRVVYDLVRANQIKKGDVLTVAQIAGIMGAKHTSNLIPLCHPIALSSVKVHLTFNEAAAAIDIEATVVTTHSTGVEMEALVAVSTAALTIYDMCKAASREMVIGAIRLEHKTGGTRGDYHRVPEQE
jgi:cyclic pyranopterin phosphate synthase